MMPLEENTLSGAGSANVEDEQLLETSSANPAAITLPPQAGTGPCLTCVGMAAMNGTTVPSYIYAIGTIEMRYPRLSVEKEFAQVMARTETKGLTDHDAMQKVLLENRYLIRQLCWVLKVGSRYLSFVAARSC